MKCVHQKPVQPAIVNRSAHSVCVGPSVSEPRQNTENSSGHQPDCFARVCVRVRVRMHQCISECVSSIRAQHDDHHQQRHHGHGHTRPHHTARVHIDCSSGGGGGVRSAARRRRLSESSDDDLNFVRAPASAHSSGSRARARVRVCVYVCACVCVCWSASLRIACVAWHECTPPTNGYTNSRRLTPVHLNK